MTQEEANKIILDGWPKERLAEEWVREHIKYNELKEENEELKKLCDKYEEEHNTTFKEWQKDIQANKEAIEMLERFYDIKHEARDLYEVLTGKKVWEGNNEYNK